MDLANIGEDGHIGKSSAQHGTRTDVNLAEADRTVSGALQAVLESTDPSKEPEGAQAGPKWCRPIL